MFCTSRTIWLTIVASALASGCAAYESNPLDPDAELGLLRDRDLEYFAVERARPGDRSDDGTPTFDPSDGLDESEVVAIALAWNPELRAKRAETGESRAALIAAGAWPNPEIGLGLRSGIAGASGTVVEADALFQLLRPDERDAEKQIAQARADEVLAEVVAAEYELVRAVREQRIRVLASERAVALLEETANLRQRSSDLVRRQRELGEATSLAVSATELELAESQRDLRQARTQFDSERRQLNELLGLPPEYDLELTGLGEPLSVTVFEDMGDDELDRRVITGRLELRASEAAYRRAEQELRLAVLQQYPSLGIGPGFERELEGDKSLGLALTLELPIFNQNQGEIAEKRSARERARAEYSALLHRLRADAFAARSAVRTAKAEIDAQEKDILPLLQRNHELFEGAYRAREINIIDWITSQQRAVEARQAYLDALVSYRRSVIQLEAATGQPLSSAATTAPSTQPN